MGEPPHPLVVRLDGHCSDVAVLGGKAAALDRLISLGCRVPTSFALTTAAYRAAVAAPPLADLLDHLRTSPVPPPSDHEQARAAVDQAFVDAALPAEVLAAIAELAHHLSGPAAANGLALRSSATAEDMSSASFAGQYRSFLNVTADGIERAVRLTWASLWHPAPRAYRAFRGLGDRVEMAVLVMAMVDPVTAGVLFTCDPAGSSDDLRLETVSGLGEALVSGAATPTAHVVPRAEAAERCRAINPVFGELVEQSLAVEAALGRPQDIEWAIHHDGTLWFLQARPITSLRHDDDPLDDGFDVPNPAATLTTAGIGEMLPGPLPPLVWEATSRQVEEGFRQLFAGLGAPLHQLDEPHALISRIHGRAAMDLDRMRAAAASIPGGSADELERRYFGSVLSSDAYTGVIQRAAPWHSVRLLLDRQRAVLECEIVIRAVAGLLDLEPDPKHHTDLELLATRARVHDLGVRVAVAEVAIAARAAAAYRGVEQFLERFLDPTAASALAQRATRAPDGARRGVTALDLTALAAAADTVGAPGRGDLATILDLDWPAARTQLATTPGGSEFLARWERALRRAGSTAVFGGPTWADHPDLAWLALRSAVADRPTPPDTARTAGAADLPSRPERVEAALGSATDTDAVLAVLADAASPARLGTARRRFLEREITDATELLDRRERTKAALLQLGGVARRLDDEIGQRLASRGLLEAPDDVRLLGTGELEALVTGHAPTLEVIARRRRHGEAARAAGPLPRRFRGRPDQQTLSTPSTGGTHGWGASPGCYEGPARVVDAPGTNAIHRGDVLVARATDASWAPLFLLAGAIVVEEGGPLSHAAIVARELGVPAVVNVPGIVEQVRRSGADTTLTVDGSTGMVALHTHAAAPPTPLAPVTPPVRTPPDEPTARPLSVFVTGLIGAGMVLSTMVALTQAAGSDRAQRRVRRRAVPPAAHLAHHVAEGRPAPAGVAGLRPPRWYGTAAALAAALGAVVLYGGLRAYTGAPDGDDAALARFTLAVLSGVPLLAGAALAARAALDWPDVPPTVRQRTAADRHDDVGLWASLPVLHRRSISALVAVTAALTMWVTTHESSLLALDEEIYERLDASRYADLWGPHWFELYFGRPQVVIPAVLVISLCTLRCRVLALAYPLAIVFGGGLNLGLGALIGRQRPPFGEHATQTDSFPSGSAIEAVLLLGLIPLAVAVLLHSRWAGRVMRVAATAVMGVMLVDGIRAGSHWPSDHVAGFCIAMVAVVFIHAIARTPSLHRHCRSCPALALAHDPPPRPDPPEDDRDC